MKLWNLFKSFLPIELDIKAESPFPNPEAIDNIIMNTGNEIVSPDNASVDHCPA